MINKLLINLSITKSLVAVTIMPIVMILLLSLWVIFPKIEDVRDYAKLDQLITLATNASSLVHEQQKERGATAVFLGSGGTEFEAQLTAQRLETNEKRKIAVADFERQFDAFRMEPAFASLASDSEAILSTLAQMDTIRSSVDAQTITIAEGIAYYTNLNGQILRFIKNISTFANDVDISSRVISFAGFLQGKERAGIERAVGSVAFSAGNFSSESLLRFQTLIQIQEIYYSVFLADASPKSIAKFEEAMASRATDSVQRMREVALEAGTMGDLAGISGDDFFQAKTEKINLLKPKTASTVGAPVGQTVPRPKVAVAAGSQPVSGEGWEEF